MTTRTSVFCSCVWEGGLSLFLKHGPMRGDETLLRRLWCCASVDLDDAMR
jgi:hypothetical protein